MNVEEKDIIFVRRVLLATVNLMATDQQTLDDLFAAQEQALEIMNRYGDQIPVG